MPRPRWAAAVVAAAGLAAAAHAQPQPTGGPPAPSFGSYLNLINRGGSPALNYYGIVRPQQQLFQQQAQLAQNQRQLGQNIQQVNSDLQSGEYGVYGQSVYGINRRIRGTGFIPSFGNTGHYFNTNPALGAGGGSRVGGGGGLSAGPRPPTAGGGGGLGAGGGRGGAGGIRR